MVSTNPLQSLLPAQGSVLRTTDDSGEQLQQGGKPEEEAPPFDDVIAQALLEDTDTSEAGPGTLDESRKDNRNENAQVTAGLTSLQDAWLAAMALMSTQLPATWQAPDLEHGTATSSPPDEAVVEVQPQSVSLSEGFTEDSENSIEQGSAPTPSLAHFGHESPLVESTGTLSEPIGEPPKPTQAKPFHASGKSVADAVPVPAIDFVPRPQEPLPASAPTLPPTSAGLLTVPIPDDSSASPPSTSNVTGVESRLQPAVMPALEPQSTSLETTEPIGSRDSDQSHQASRTASEVTLVPPNERSSEAPHRARRSASSVPVIHETATATATGTSTAKTSTKSKRLEEMGSPRRHTERTLPEAATLAAVSADSARTKTRSPSGAVLSPDDYSSVINSAVQASSFTTPRAATSLASDAAELPKTPVADIQRLEQRILGVVAEVKRLKPDSMSVVLKPDGQTELHLQLRIEGGSVDVEARVQRGDGSALGGHWAQLQQNLASQGVRLGDLQSAPIPQATGSDWSGGFSKQHREQTAREELPEPLREPALPQTAATVGKTKSTPKLDRRSWESWA